VAAKQMKGFGGMISFEVKGGTEAGKKVAESVKLITLAVSLGGVNPPPPKALPLPSEHMRVLIAFRCQVESLICHAATTTHVMVPRDVRLKGGITDGLIRFSVGIEDKDDLLRDLEQALDKI
jgi:methionine-gamma-lyase